MVRPTLVDRAAGDARVIVSMGPLVLPSRAQLATELSRLARISAGNRLGLTRERPVGGGRWRYDPDRLGAAVRNWSDDFPGTDQLDITDKVILLRRTTATPDGLRLYLAGDHLITDLPHAVFGGTMVVALWVYLSRCASRPTPAWVTTPSKRPHVASILARHLATRPRHIGDLAAAVRRRTPPAAAVTGAPSSPVVSPAAQMMHAPLPTTATGYLDAPRRAVLQEWRDAHAPDCSMAVLLMTVLTRAFAAVGVELAPVVHVVVDTGRYDAALAQYLGNAAVGLNLAFAAPHDPAVLQRELGEAMACGRPLAAMLAISAGEVVGTVRRRVGRPAGIAADPGPATVLSFSHLLGLDSMPGGDWIGGFDAHRFTAMTDPVGARGIAILTPRMGDRYDISASFDARCHPPDRVRAALDLATTNPLALLTTVSAPDVGEHT